MNPPVDEDDASIEEEELMIEIVEERVSYHNSLRSLEHETSEEREQLATAAAAATPCSTTNHADFIPTRQETKEEEEAAKEGKLARAPEPCKEKEGSKEQREEEPTHHDAPLTDEEEGEPAAGPEESHEPGAYHVGTPNDFDDQLAALEMEAQTYGTQEEQQEEMSWPTQVSYTTPSVAAWVHASRPQAQATAGGPVHASNNHNSTSNSSLHQTVEGTTVYQAQEEDPNSTADSNHHKNQEDAMRRLVMPLMGGGVFLMLTIIVLLTLGLLGVFQATNGNSSHNPLRPPSESSTAQVQPSTETNSPSISTTPIKSTLQQIKEEGVLKVIGYNEIFPFYFTDDSGQLTGFEYAIAKAIAAAIFGTTDPPVEVVSDVTTSNVFSTLANPQQAHLMLRTVSWTMERQVFQAQAKQGFSQAGVYVYDGTRVAGDPFFVKCAETFDHLGDCQDLMVCVGNQTTQLSMLQDVLPSRNIAILQTHSMVHEAFINGTCNTFLHESASSQEYIVRAFGYQGDYLVSPKLLTKETGTIVTRADDAEFSTFVNSVLHALFEAEKHNITQSTATNFPPTQVFGEEYQFMFQKAIGASGNYGEIYAQFLGPLIPRDNIAMNRINDGTTGQIMALKFGDISNDRGPIPLSSKMRAILDRGTLRCGVRVGRPGFATMAASETESEEWAALLPYFDGMEVDFCRALAASLFQGSTEQVEFVSFETQQDGFQLLAQEQVDVIGGVTWNLANDAKEPSTGLGFSFSAPYFYSFSEEEDNFALATRSEDHEWYSFVYWIVSALVYAEELGLDSATSNRMPEVFIYGSVRKRVFRDAVLAVGSYGSMYERHLEPLYPRSGRNNLNAIPHLGPQFYSLPGLIQ